MQKPRGVRRRAGWAGYIGIVGAVFVCAVSWPPGGAAAQNACVGDCSGNDAVTIDELILSVNIALGTQPLTACDAIDANSDDHATVDELVRAVNASLEGCPTATATDTPLATATLTLLPATVTPLPTGTASATVTELPATVTPLPTGTASATVTELPATVTPLPTGTASATVTDTPAPAATDTVAPSATATETPSASATPTPTPTQTPGPAPSGLTAVIDGSEIHLSWVNSDPIFGHTAVRLVRRLNAAPDGPDDPEAVGVFAGTAASAVDDLTALLPDVPEAAPGTTAMPRTYYYTVYGCMPGGECETDGSSTTLKPTLVQVLRGGGYTIYWRHAQAAQCVDASLGSAATTQCPDWWKRCESMCQTTAPICPLAGSPLATARQLVDTGRDQATAIGQAFDLRGIPIGRVISSEYCRTVQTAQLMDFGPAIETNQGITFSVYDESNRCEHSLELLSEVPAPGSNTAVIGHLITAEPCLPISDSSLESAFQMSEAAVFKPDGQGGGQFVDRVLWYEWADLP